MPYITVNDVRLFYEDTGVGDETLIFSHGLLWNGKMFDDQVAALKDRYRCITYDHRAQGRSEVSAAPFDMELLYADAVALIEKLGVAPVHFAGLSMGGFMALRLAARRPDLVKSIILMETSADPEPEENKPKYQRLNFAAKILPLRWLAKPIMKIMFGQKYLTDPARVADRQAKIEQLAALKRSITRSVTAVIQRKGVYEELDKIKVPTLILVGDQDVATVPEKSKRIHARIPHSQLIMIPGAGHSSSMEDPRQSPARSASFWKASKHPSDGRTDLPLRLRLYPRRSGSTGGRVQSRPT